MQNYQVYFYFLNQVLSSQLFQFEFKVSNVKAKLCVWWNFTALSIYLIKRCHVIHFTKNQTTAIWSKWIKEKRSWNTFACEQTYIINTLGQKSGNQKIGCLKELKISKRDRVIKFVFKYKNNSFKLLKKGTTYISYHSNMVLWCTTLLKFRWA